MKRYHILVEKEEESEETNEYAQGYLDGLKDAMDQIDGSRPSLRWAYNRIKELEDEFIEENSEST